MVSQNHSAVGIPPFADTKMKLAQHNYLIFIAILNDC
jgi:hypothetical protein